MKLKLFLCSKLFVIAVSGCSNYQVTLNNQEIRQQTPLFSGFSVVDTKLNACVEEHIQDQRAISSESLEFLNCSHNEIKSLAGIEGFTGLRRIDVSHNQIESISELLKLNDLVAVDLSDNPKLNCEEYQQLKRLKPGLKIKHPAHCQ